MIFIILSGPGPGRYGYETEYAMWALLAAIDSALLFRSSQVIERFRLRISFRDEFVLAGEVFIFNLRWTVSGVQCHNFGLFIADVEVHLLCEEIESPGRLLPFFELVRE